MGGALLKLLGIEASTRTTEDYEAVFDDFFAMQGGCRLGEKLRIPTDIKNADYVIDNRTSVVVVELKQVRSYELTHSFMSRIFKFMSERGGISLKITGTNYAIVGKPSERSSWLSFYDSIRPGVIKQLKDANRQLHSTAPLVSRDSDPTVSGVMLFNTADEHLSTDLLRMIVEARMKYAWMARQFRAIDFVIAGTLDMGFENRHPQECFILRRRTDNTVVTEAINSLWACWTSYLISEVGENSSKEFREMHKPSRGDIEVPFLGKLQRKPTET